MRPGLVVGIALILIGLFAGAGNAQSADRCTQIKQDTQRDINRNLERMRELDSELGPEVQRYMNDPVRAREAYKRNRDRYIELRDDNSRLANRAAEECQRAAQELQTSRQIFQPPAQLRNPTMPPPRYR